MLKSILFGIFIYSLAGSYNQNIENVYLKIQSIAGDYILFEIENKNGSSIQIGNPECWTNLQTFLTINSEEIPVKVRYKQNISCINDLIVIESKRKRDFKVKYKTTELYSRLRGEGEIELHFFGLILSKGEVVKEYGTMLKSAKVNLDKIKR
jgi:hypothetical protein